MAENDLTRLKARVKGLEEKVKSLRTSRQVLMNLLSIIEKDRRAKINRLERENHRLRNSSTKFARAVLERNCKIYHLEQALKTDQTLI